MSKVYYLFSLDHKKFYDEVSAPLHEVLYRGRFHLYTDIVNDLLDCPYTDARLVAIADDISELKTRKVRNK